jgi:sensor histidine kinase YesM
MLQFRKDIGNAALVGTLIYLVIMLILYFTGGFDNGFSWQMAWREYYENIVFSIFLYLINIYTWRFFAEKYGSDFRSLKRVLIGLSSSFVVSLIGIFISRVVIEVLIKNKPFVTFLQNERPSLYYTSMIIAGTVIAVFYGFYFYKASQETKVKEQKIIADTASAKFNALKNQLDPHFLFNSLNVLTSLIDEDPHQAQKFTTSLSKVYRYVLEQKNKDLVTVNEELKFAKTYVRLLKMRFEDSIIFEIPEQSEDPDAKIVPLSLQLLLENAVKHNVVTAEKPLHIKVAEVNGMLQVSNNLQEKQVVKKSSGVGLHNIQQRYGILTERVVEIEKTTNDFSVGLPILTRQVTMMETQQTFIEDKLYEKAKQRVEEIKGFYGNLISYCLVIPFLWFINYRTTDFLWAIFPTLGWGFGVSMHAMEAFGVNPLWGKKWEEKKMRELMDDDDF